MNRLSKFALANLFCLTASLPAAADDSVNQYSTQQTTTNTQALVDYLLNLGGYLGYDLTKQPTENNNTVSQKLLPSTSALAIDQLIYAYVLDAFLGASPVNAFSTALAQFLPEESPNASTLNPWANYTFASQSFSNPQAQQQGKVSVSQGIDQPTFQQDPVSQAVLNILGTPDSSYCMSNDGSTWVGCSQQATGTNLLPGNLVTANIIGPLPSKSQYFTYQYNQQFLGQLNSNILTAPLLYSTQSTNTTEGDSSATQSVGLAAQNQAQQAANFIRYVSGSVTPVPLPNQSAYDKLYMQANPNPAPATPSVQQIQAQATLNNYFTALRTYAAQYSVGMGNLYYIMSKRLPQNLQGGTAGTQSSSSEALSEFNMATWRLYNPNTKEPNAQWINQLNNASPATVQKEIATLLAEINYQMYLDRQIQERILLTNSIMLLQNTRSSQPSPNFSAGADDTNQQ